MKRTLKFNKLCPFCPQAQYKYYYKTWDGLLRHVHKEHLKVISRNRTYENSWDSFGYKWKLGKLIYIRIYDVLYSKYHDMDIESPNVCEKLLLAYVTDNPSFRGISKELKI